MIFNLNKIQILLKEIINNDCYIIINCFSNWNNNSNNINSLIYLNYIRNKSDSCVIFVKNNFLNLDNANKEKDINEFENIVFKDKKNIKNFPEIIFNNNNHKNLKECSLFIVENNFDYQSDNIDCDLTINDKKNKEKYNLLISNFSNNINLLNIDFSDIIILFDINYSVLNLENSIQSLLNKYIYYYFKN